MMKKSTSLLLTVGAVAGLGLAGLWQYKGYRARVVALDAEVVRYQTALADRDQVMQDKARVGRELRKAAATTLGTDEERVTAVLRRELNEIVAYFKLADASVTSSRPTAVRNPAGKEGVVEFVDRKRKDLRNQVDFYVLPATITGKGTLEQATRVLSTLESQPWVHKIDSFSIQPLGKDRERVELTVSLATLYIADPTLIEKGALDNPTWSPVSEAQFAAWRPIVTKNVFREPQPEAPVAAAPRPAPEPGNVAAAPPAPPPPPPYEEWRISGITVGEHGAELMIVNEKTKEWRTLSAGGQVLDVKFVDAAGETARILIGDKEFEVRAGQRLSERSVVSR